MANIGVIMAGGRGTRLRPLTLERPKPMLEVVGIPVIDFIKNEMIGAGVDEIIVTTGYKGDCLAQHVNSWNRSGIVARVNEEAVPMGTAGSVRLLKEHLKETFIVASGDTLAAFDIASLLARHKQQGAMATMALSRVKEASEYGIVGLSEQRHGEVDANLDSGWVVRFKEKPAPEEMFSKLINAGLYIIEPEVLDLIPEGEKFDWSRQVFPSMLQRGMPLQGCAISGVWFDIGRPADLLRAQTVIISNQEGLATTLPAGKCIDGGFVSSSTRLRGSCSASVMLENSTVEQDAILLESLLMQGSTISKGSRISTSIIGRDVFIGQDCVLVNCVIGDGMRVEEGSDWNGVIYPPNDVA